MRNSLRLFSGLILFTFVLGHLINHSLGLISIDVANQATRLFTDPWRTMLGSIILGGAALIHVGCAIWSLWVRRSLKLPAWEMTQLVLGLSAPLFLAAHIAATRGLTEVADFESSYAFVVGVLWVFSPMMGVLQGVALVVVWSHGCLGLHAWLRFKPWYSRIQGLALGLAVAMPVAALAGYVAMGSTMLQRATQPDWWQRVIDQTGFQPWMSDFVAEAEDIIQLGLITLIAVVLVAYVARHLAHRMKRKPLLTYAPSDRQVELVPGATLLESIRSAGIEHASICGGRGRCSTCRVRVINGLDSLPDASDAETKALSRHTTSKSVRLACQIRPTESISVMALVPANVTPVQLVKKIDHMPGEELTVAFLFVDLRGSTKLCEDRLPFDVVFILNQFFAELSLALSETDGHYAQFNGDGLMAIYGLQSDPKSAAIASLRGAKAMLDRIEALNTRLGDELSEPLRIGVGIHMGDAIVGSMGPPSTPIISALGDTVNVAARLESLTKELEVPLVISKDTSTYAGYELQGAVSHTVPVKGRDAEMDILAISDLSEIHLDGNAEAAE